jgi:hypothetical protein
MAEPWLELDAVLRERLRDVLQEPPRPLTESELRSLLEEGRACMLILNGELDRLERRLAELDSDPHASFSAITEAFRRVNRFRAHVEELRLIGDIERRGGYRTRRRPGRDSLSQSVCQLLRSALKTDVMTVSFPPVCTVRSPETMAAFVWTLLSRSSERPRRPGLSTRGTRTRAAGRSARRSPALR